MKKIIPLLILITLVFSFTVATAQADPPIEEEIDQNWPDPPPTSEQNWPDPPPGDPVENMTGGG